MDDAQDFSFSVCSAYTRGADMVALSVLQGAGGGHAKACIGPRSVRRIDRIGVESKADRPRRSAKSNGDAAERPEIGHEAAPRRGFDRTDEGSGQDDVAPRAAAAHAALDVRREV